MSLREKRKTFEFYDPITCQTYIVRAAGIMLYKVDESGNIKVLIQNRMKYFEDLGGKTSIVDLTIYNTAIRELREETNNYVNVTKKRLRTSTYIYNPNAKYLLFLVKAVGMETTCNSELFDYYENNDYFKKFRMIIWENIYDLLEFPTHPRLDEDMINKIIHTITVTNQNIY